MQHPFKINHLDHVAILVEDMERTIEWYQSTLGLTAISPDEWNGVPTMLFVNMTGVAVFPKASPGASDRSIKFVDHFAFNVDKDAMDAAMEFFNDSGIAYTWKDHKYYHSIYFKDPDGHTVELTTQVIDI